MPWGHRAIARAIFGYLKKHEKEADIRVDYVEVDPKLGLLNDFYTFAYRLVPSTNRVSYRLMNYRVLRDLFLETTIRDVAGLKKVVNKYKPDLIISCYFFHSISLARLREDFATNYKLWTVVADPWSINPISFVEEADLNLVYDEVGISEGLRLGVKRERLMATGWWTREEMFDPQLRIANYKLRIKQRLGFGDDRPIIFVGGGSLGTSSLPRVLAALMLVKKPVGLIINTGTDKLSYNLVEEYVRLFKRIRTNDLVQIKNMGWIDNMGEILSVCDIVFGKAGPNFLFDAVASEKPFVATTHIGGQEDGNIELIVKKKLGWVKEKNWEISEFLLAYLRRPEWYNHRFDQNIKEEAERNKRCLPVMLELVKKHLPKG